MPSPACGLTWCGPAGLSCDAQQVESVKCIFFLTYTSNSLECDPIVGRGAPAFTKLRGHRHPLTLEYFHPPKKKPCACPRSLPTPNRDPGHRPSTSFCSSLLSPLCGAACAGHRDEWDQDVWPFVAGLWHSPKVSAACPRGSGRRRRAAFRGRAARPRLAGRWVCFHFRPQQCRVSTLVCKCLRGRVPSIPWVRRRRGTAASGGNSTFSSLRSRGCTCREHRARTQPPTAPRPAIPRARGPVSLHLH